MINKFVNTHFSLVFLLLITCSAIQSACAVTPNEVQALHAKALLSQQKLTNAGDITVKGVWGLYRDWMLTARASATQNIGENTGAYKSKLFELVLTQRF